MEKKSITKKTLKDFSNEEIEKEFLIRYREEVTDGDILPEALQSIFVDLGHVENIDKLFKSIILKDMHRFFNSPAEGQAVVRGAVLRTQYLMQEARKASGRTKKLK